ncbi:MAG: hypothetical protein V4672_10690 [Verrucomicrobiota bacterium]
MTRVFKIIDKYVIEGKGIALSGIPFLEVADCGLAKEAEVEVKSAGLGIAKTKLAGFELMRNCWSPHKPKAMCVLLNLEDFELPKDAELWIEVSGIIRQMDDNVIEVGAP